MKPPETSGADTIALFTAMMLFLPAGLCVYMLTNSVLSIAQQKFIQFRMDKNTPSTGGAVVGAVTEATASGSSNDSPTLKSNKSSRRPRRGRA